VSLPEHHEIIDLVFLFNSDIAGMDMWLVGSARGHVDFREWVAGIGQTLIRLVIVNVYGSGFGPNGFVELASNRALDRLDCDCQMEKQNDS
jgi:hypothetical protein